MQFLLHYSLSQFNLIFETLPDNYSRFSTFLCFSSSFIVMIIVLSKLPRKSQAQTLLPPENIIGAIRAQIHYVRHSQAAHVLMVRAGLFTLCSSALLSLLPLLAKHELRLDSTGFGLLLGSFWYGSNNWRNCNFAKIAI